MRMRIEPRIAGLYRLYRQLAAQLFPITPHITDPFLRMLAESKDGYEGLNRRAGRQGREEGYSRRQGKVAR
jgi:hypothetical protein